MVHVLVRHTIADYKTWRGVFDASLEFRHQGGEQSCRIFRDQEKDGEIVLLFEWESAQRAHVFMGSPELKVKMEAAGVLGPPEIHYLSEMYTIRRSAAD
jgi:quinol monooxygenase YgiN